jgi:hypothetical protein
VPGRLNVVEGLKRTNQIVSLEEVDIDWLGQIPARIDLARDHSKVL